MTALLAFFIVLNSLASVQTGAALYSGTGSFVQVGDSMGVSGLFPMGRSPYPVQMDQPSPLYIVSDDEEEASDTAANGPDENGEASHVQDREQDDLERFLLDMEKLHNAKAQKGITGEVAFDRMRPLPHDGDPMDDVMQQQLLKFAPILRRAGYELEIRVWATTPAPSAWLRAATQASRIHAAALTFLKLRSDQAPKLTATASPWHSSTIQRPAVSFLLRRVE